MTQKIIDVYFFLTPYLFGIAHMKVDRLTDITVIFEASTHIFVDNNTKLRRIPMLGGRSKLSCPEFLKEKKSPSKYMFS